MGATKPLVDSDADSLDADAHAAQRHVPDAPPRAPLHRDSLHADIGAIINISSIVAVAPELLNGTYAGQQGLRPELHAIAEPRTGTEGGAECRRCCPERPKPISGTPPVCPLNHLPSEIVMDAEEMVDAALVGFDRRELVAIPSLPDAEDWDRFDAARRALGPHLSLSQAAARYRV